MTRVEKTMTRVRLGEGGVSQEATRATPFILAYSAEYGEQKIPVDDEGAIARFAIRLRPGIYYLFVVLDGYEPTCHVADIGAGEVVLYNPTIGNPVVTNVINEYTVRPKKKDLQLPWRHVQLPAVSPIPPQ
jgi:hypothetical protein